MIRLKETIHVEKNIAAVFKYVSDFSNIQEWDPGVLSSEKNRPGETGPGTSFDLVLKFGPFRPRMRYTVKAFHPPTRVVLEGRAESFTAKDTIRFTKIDRGTRIDYAADIRFSGFQKKLEPLLKPILKKTGEHGIKGLEQVLNGPGLSARPVGWFRSGAGLADWLADHLILPGMLLFSRLGYDFNRRFWKKTDPSLYGKRVVLTGGTSGIGKAAAFELAQKKAFLTLVARNEKKAEAVCRQITEKTGNIHVDYVTADLSLLRDVKKAGRQIKNRLKTVDVLINNAGALFNERKETVEGFEMTFATDLLGVFYLTELLKNHMACGGRIINVSSGGMYTQKIDVDDLENNSGVYNGAKAYARAKRGVVILTRLWAAQLAPKGIAVHSMHPGWVDTPGIEKSLPEFHTLTRRILRTPQQGADTIVWLASSGKAGQCTGRFWLDRRPHETVVFPGTGETAGERRRLWEKLEEKLSQTPVKSDVL